MAPGVRYRYRSSGPVRRHRRPASGAQRDASSAASWPDGWKKPPLRSPPGRWSSRWVRRGPELRTAPPLHYGKRPLALHGARERQIGATTADASSGGCAQRPRPVLRAGLVRVHAIADAGVPLPGRPHQVGAPGRRRGRDRLPDPSLVIVGW